MCFSALVARLIMVSEARAQIEMLVEAICQKVGGWTRGITSHCSANIEATFSMASTSS